VGPRAYVVHALCHCLPRTARSNVTPQGNIFVTGPDGSPRRDFATADRDLAISLLKTAAAIPHGRLGVPRTALEIAASAPNAGEPRIACVVVKLSPSVLIAAPRRPQSLRRGTRAAIRANVRHAARFPT